MKRLLWSTLQHRGVELSTGLHYRAGIGVGGGVVAGDMALWDGAAVAAAGWIGVRCVANCVADEDGDEGEAETGLQRGGAAQAQVAVVVGGDVEPHAQAGVEGEASPLREP